MLRHTLIINGLVLTYSNKTTSRTEILLDRIAELKGENNKQKRESIYLTWFNNLPRVRFDQKLPAIKMSKNKLEATQCLSERDCVLNV